MASILDMEMGLVLLAGYVVGGIVTAWAAMTLLCLDDEPGWALPAAIAFVVWPVMLLLLLPFMLAELEGRPDG